MTAYVPSVAGPPFSRPPESPRHRALGVVRRTSVGDATRDRLYFAQVREDPLLELAFLEPRSAGRYVVVTSGGCTALSFLARGAGHVVAVDVNTSQNNLLELKLQAIRNLEAGQVLQFLGAAPASEDRWLMYERLREALTPEARKYWNAKRDAIRQGVLGAGVTERFVRHFVRLLRWGVLGRKTLEDVLRQPTLQAQDRFYRIKWDTWRWRLLVRLLLSRRSLAHTYDRSFFQEVEEEDFARTFRARIEHTLTALPVSRNYFLHHMLTGAYLEGCGAGLPPYLEQDGLERIRRGDGELEVVDGSLFTYLKGCSPRTFDGFAASNIAEWLTGQEVDRLFGQVVRTAAPGARLCFRNFVGWTEVPPSWRAHVLEDRRLGSALMRTDRSLVQRRFAPCRIVSRSVSKRTEQVEVREARPEDDAALRRLAAACPMRGDIEICVEREPSFFALTRLEGEHSELAVTPDREGRPVGCVAAAERQCFLNGLLARIAHVGDLKVHPSKRDHRSADALSRWAVGWVGRRLGSNGTALVTVLAGNHAMERRLPGSDRLPAFTRVGTIRTYSVPVIGRPAFAPAGLHVHPASRDDLDEMCRLWRRVAPLRHFAFALDPEGLRRWLADAPGLSAQDYLLARDVTGALVGFLALWDQRSFKQLRVVRYSRRMRAFRSGFNAVSPLLRARRLPPAGSLIHCMSAVHVCVPPHRPDVMRALLAGAYRTARRAGAAFINVGLDKTERLGSAFRGLLAQPTDVHVHVTGAAGHYTGPSLDARPLHYEIALV